MNLAARAIPVKLPADIREEVRQAIILDLLTNQIEAGALFDPRFVRRYVSAAYGFQDRYKFKSLDAPLNDDGSGRTLADLLAA